MGMRVESNQREIFGTTYGNFTERSLITIAFSWRTGLWALVVRVDVAKRVGRTRHKVLAS
jgi:hypothetical protein